jgi:hypothetical protein
VNLIGYHVLHLQLLLMCLRDQIALPELVDDRVPDLYRAADVLLRTQPFVLDACV